MFDVAGLRGIDSRAYVAIVSTADFRSAIFNAFGAIE